MRLSPTSRFVFKVVAVSAAAYLISGGLAYQLLTKRFYVGDDAVFAGFLRSESNAVEWAHVMRWQIPALLARSVLIALALLPFRQALLGLPMMKRGLALFSLFFVMLHFAAAAPSPSNLEGLVYMRPQFLSASILLLTQPEMILQCLLMAVGIAAWGGKRPDPADAA